MSRRHLRTPRDVANAAKVCREWRSQLPRHAAAAAAIRFPDDDTLAPGLEALTRSVVPHDAAARLLPLIVARLEVSLEIIEQGKQGNLEPYRRYQAGKIVAAAMRLLARLKLQLRDRRELATRVAPIAVWQMEFYILNRVDNNPIGVELIQSSVAGGAVQVDPGFLQLTPRLLSYLETKQ